MDGLLNFQPNQILCLEHENASLYVEVIQVVAVRQLCWVRPLVLVIRPEQSLDTEPTWYDLRQGADLLWSAANFRTALDTEVIPLLAQLGNAKVQPESDHLARQQLHSLMQRVWQARADQPQA
jgi:hypothetical protein